MGTYHSTLRQRQARQTRELILTCVAQAVRERGAAELAIRDVASRADVSERTVYRYFPTREDLLDGLAEWVREQIVDRGVDEESTGDVHELGEAVVESFRALDELGELAEAMVLVSASTGSTSARHDERTELFRQVLAPRLSQLDHDPEAVFGVIRHLLSALSWYVLRTEFGLDGERAGRAVTHVMTAVLADSDGDSKMD